jgi:hypothetical protein
MPMPKKGYNKKKAWRQGCRSKVREGLINGANGGWVVNNSSKRSDVEMRDGYRVGRR